LTISFSRVNERATFEQHCCEILEQHRVIHFADLHAPEVQHCAGQILHDRSIRPGRKASPLDVTVKNGQALIYTVALQLLSNYDKTHIFE
jgi:hypothetical protein